MAASSTTFSQRMKKINAGKTTAWTVPGEGLAGLRDERRFLAKAGKTAPVRKKSTQSRTSIVKYVLALLAGAISVIAARWLDFTFLDTALAFATEQGIDAANIIGDISTSLVLAITLGFLTMLILGLRKTAVYVQVMGFLGAFLFEADLVALAPDVYAIFYPPAWVADMLANATLVI